MGEAVLRNSWGAEGDKKRETECGLASGEVLEREKTGLSVHARFNFAPAIKEGRVKLGHHGENTK